MTANYEEIRQLYMEQLTGTLSEADAIRFDTLLNTDPEAKGIVNELDMEAQNINASRFLANIDEAKELRELNQLLERKPVLRMNPWTKWTAVAAALLFVAMGIFFYKQHSTPERKFVAIKNAKPAVRLQLANGKSVELSRGGSSNTITVGDLKLETNGNSLNAATGSLSSEINTLTVPAKESYKIVLADGTKVWLNSKSILKFPFRFSGNIREITLEGEAYFEVAHQPERPFIVHAGHTKVEVLGTHFNVNTYTEEAVKTSLFEGKVELTAAGGKVIQLTPGYEAEFNSHTGFKVTGLDKEDVLSWMNGVYYFNNVPLSKLSEIVPRWFDISVVFDRPELLNYHISGLLEKNQLQEFLADLETSARVKWYFRGNVLHIK